MKTKSLIIAIILFLGIENNYSQINMTTNGYVTIGSTVSASQPLDVRGHAQFITGSYNGNNSGILINGYYDQGTIDPIRANSGLLGYNYRWSTLYINDIFVTNPVHVSDARCKSNISVLTNSLPKLIKLQGVTYDYKPAYFANTNSKGPSVALNNQIGLLAQDVQKIFPQVVVYDSAHDMYGIKYDNLIPVVIEAIKEQQSQIDSLKQIIKKSSGSLKSASISDSATTKTTGISLNNTSILYQNNPNPFNSETTVKFYIDDNVRQAIINIYDLTGFQIKSFPINTKGNGSIVINANELHPGIFIYNLLTDGQEVSSKRMVLTQ